MHTKATLSDEKAILAQKEQQDLKAKLDALWSRFEHEKEITMVVTRQEVEKAKMGELEDLVF